MNISARQGLELR